MKKFFGLALLVFLSSILLVGCGKSTTTITTKTPTTTDSPISSSKVKTTENKTTVKEKVDVTFEVQIPKLEAGEYTFVIFGSFSDWKLSSDYSLTLKDGKYSITLNLEKGMEVEYKYAILGSSDTDTSKVELDVKKENIENRKVLADSSKTVSDSVKRFKDVLLDSEVVTTMAMLDDTFYDNDQGKVHQLSYENNVLKVNYSKGAGKSYACIIRPVDDEAIGKLETISFTFKGEAGVEFLFKVEGGDSALEDKVTATGDVQTYTLKISETARNSRRIVIFAHPGKTGTDDEPITGSYELHSILATLRNFPTEEEEYVPGDNPIHILAIGNSFSDDGLWLLYNILEQLGYDDIIVANLYIGGCTVETHKNNLQNDKAAYTYRINKDGTWSSREGYKASAVLKAYDWDFISLQQASNYSGLKSYYKTEEIDYIYQYAYDLAKEKNPDVKFVWQMTWAYQQNSTHSAFVNYDKNQMTMYNGILTATQEVIVPDKFNPIIVPSGTTIQNLRTTFIGDNVTRDGYHLNESFARFSAALTWAIKLTGKDISAVKAPQSVQAKYVPLCRESAINACLKPFEITESEYKTDESQVSIDYSKLELLDPSEYIIGNGYYNSQDATKFLTPIQDGSDFCNGFITTKLMTKEDLPIGSVITVSGGYRYRPEGWINEARQTTRNDNTTDTQVVTEDWWGSYIYRAFNISRISGGVLTGDAYDDALNNFKIYVPKKVDKVTISAKSIASSSNGYANWNEAKTVATFGELKNTITGGQWTRWDYDSLEDLGYTKVSLSIRVTPGLKAMAKLDASTTPKNNAYDSISGNKQTKIAGDDELLSCTWDLSEFKASANAAGLEFNVSNLTKLVFMVCDGSGQEEIMTSATLEVLSFTFE